MEKSHECNMIISVVAGLKKIVKFSQCLQTVIRKNLCNGIQTIHRLSIAFFS